MKFVIILQARTGSKRLRNKMTTKISKNINLLEFILLRLKKIKYFETIVATTFLKEDNIICEIAKNNGYKYFRGSKLNLLNRIYKCALEYNAENVIRLTGDNPFFEINLIKELAKFHEEKKLEYSSNTKFLPKGVGFEIFSIKALKKIKKSEINISHKEHINEFIFENPDNFMIGDLNPKINLKLPKINLTLDTINDLYKIRKIIKKINYKTDFKLKDLIKCI